MYGRSLWYAFVGICVVLVIAPAVCSAQAFVTGFDWDPSGNPIPPDFALGYVNSAMGLTFEHTGPTANNCNGVFANTYGPLGFGSAPNVISVCPSNWFSDMSEATHGLIQVRSDWDLVNSCIDVDPAGPTHAAVMRAYDAGGALVDEQLSTPGVRENLCVTGYRIRRVEFSGYGSSFASFDNFGIGRGEPVPQIYYLPGAAHLDGFGGARWRTDLEVQNPNSWEATFWLENLPRDQGNPSPAQFEFTLPAGESMRFVDVLGTVFGYTGAATIRVASWDRLLTTSRNYNDAATGTYGMFVSGKSVADATGPGQTGRLIQLTQSASDTTGYRTNIGVANVSEFPIAIDIELYDSSGALLGSVSDTLDLYESVQFDKIFRRVSASAVLDGYAIVSSPTPQAKFLAFATPVDNRTGDGFYFPAISWPPW